jgi:hypothetical protein
MSQQQKQQHCEGNDDKGEDIRSIEGSEWSVEEENIVGHGNAKQKEEESNPKIALLEVNNLSSGMGSDKEKIRFKIESFSGQ